MKLISVHDAARILGLTVGGVKYHCRRGTLKAVRMPTAYNAPYEWQVYADAVEGFKANGRRSLPWSDADAAALLELTSTCTNAQIAKYLGKTEEAVVSRLKWLAKRGEYSPGKCGSKRQRCSPFEIPSRAILLAKTCLKCGLLRDGSCFYLPFNGHYFHTCKVCQAAHMRKRKAEGKVKPTDHTRDRELQAITIPLATRRHQPYTSTELEAISDISKSDFQVAIETGRTLYGIQITRAKNEFRQRPTYVKAHWIIKFPKALKTLQKHFAEIGEPLPEEFWDLKESEIANQDHRPITRKTA